MTPFLHSNKFFILLIILLRTLPENYFTIIFNLSPFYAEIYYIRRTYTVRRTIYPQSPKGGIDMLGVSRAKSVSSVYRNGMKKSRSLSNTTTTEAIESTDKSSSNMANSTTTQQYNVDLFYEDLDDLKDAYQQFNHDEHELEENLMHFLEHKDELLKEIIALTKAYNRAILSLHQFDRAFSTSNIDHIASVLLRYQYRMKTLGLYISSNYQIDVEESRFLDKFESDPKTFNFLFNSKNGVFILIFNIFHDIKIPQKHHVKTLPPDFQGSFIDWKG